MNILLLGSGGREHAFAWKLSQSPLCKQLFIVPGNPGTAMFGKNVDLSSTDFNSIADFIATSKIDLVVVGPEEPLIKGITDFLKKDERSLNVLVVGPTAKGAALEGSKDVAKEFMQRHSIPTAAYQTFTKENILAGYAFLKTLNTPYVLKADGLAAGKGVLIIDDLKSAEAELKEMLEGRFGAASNKVVIEEFLKGIELSVFVLTDGTDYLLLPSAKDYKRIGDGDTGLNTGGMGAVSPVPFADAVFMKKVEERIIIPTVRGLRDDKIDYKGFVFIGLMNVNGDPFVIEYNVRMGDPETEAVLPRIKSDLVQLLSDCASGKLRESKIEMDSRTALTVVVVSGGYPGTYSSGKEISISETGNCLIFHSGTSQNKNGKLLNSGGRVLAITSLANGIQEARDLSYTQIKKINFSEMNYRTDIGMDLL